MSSSIEEKTVTRPWSPESANPTTQNTPNVPLVESLVQVILSLSQEEKELLEEKLNRKKNWRETLKQIREHKAAIHAERGRKPFQPPIDEIIQGASHICKYICRSEAFRRQVVSEVDRLTIEMLRPCESEMHPFSIIHQMREERTEQLMQASFPVSEEK